MASIPLPALHVNPPAEQPNLLQMAAQVYGIKNAQQEQQVRAQQIQAAQQENRQRQIQMDQTQAVNDAYHGSLTVDESGNPKIDTGKLSQSLAESGHGNAVPGILKNITDYQKSSADLQETQSKVQTAASDSLGYLGAAIKQANYDPHLADLMIEQRLKTPGIPAQESQRLTQIRGAIQQDPNALKNMVDQMVAQSPKQQEFASSEKVANIRANSGVEVKEMNDFVAHPPAGYHPSPLGFQKYKQDQARESEISKETDPRVIRSKMNLQASEAQIQQNIKDGSPKDAGVLLAGGVAAPSEIKAQRSPSFFIQSVNEARKIDPSYNPQKAEADFAIAKSPENTRFFGSANSLINKGGTLDQLAAAGKDIPDGKIPVFNTIADAEKAATGSGPISKYAAVALGVADDYSKVMGGGTGSDSSREQALKLISANLSPDGRTQAIEGIRGAVGSQTESRVGNNKVLKLMYGKQSPVASSAPITVTDPRGVTHIFKSQADADNFKKLANIQ